MSSSERAADRRMLMGSMVMLMSCLVAAAPAARVPNTTIQMPPGAGPDEVLAYTTVDAFPGIEFREPLGMRTPPGETNCLFVFQQGGIIKLIPDLNSPSLTDFLDISSRVTSGGELGLLGLAFHPDYASNGYFYVFYTGTNVTPCPGCTGRHDILSRFQVSSTNPHLADADSEVFLIRQKDEETNHNGGDLHFGADGYLYVSLGDEGGANDSRNNSQVVTGDFFSGMLRIDVDRLPGNLTPHPHPSINGAATNYAVPVDNPFVGITSFNGSAVSPGSVRTEFYAVGLRNPWRFTIDPVTHRIYCGDVGQGAREEVSVIESGGNYGWAFREGFTSGPKGAPLVATNLKDPILDYPRNGAGNYDGTTVIGGRVYRGDRLPELLGRYIFADYGSGEIWSLLYDGSSATEWTNLANTADISGFGIDPRNGDILVATLANGGSGLNDFLRRLVRDEGGSQFSLPETLDDTGVFADLQSLTPHAGIEPYNLNVPFWSDGAYKMRWFSVPPTNLFIEFDPGGNWGFPTSAVWVKHFELELTNGVPSSRRRLETRLLVRNNAGVYGVTYLWGHSKTNAQLLANTPGGLDEEIVVNDSGVIRTQVWHYPSRSECQECHTAEGGYALGFNTRQLNLEGTSGILTGNQVAALAAEGYFSTNVGYSALWPALAPMDDTSASTAYRARSYLEANCSQCHFPGPGLWDARIEVPLSRAGLIDGTLNDNLGDVNNRVLVRGSVSNTVLLTRMSALNGIRMPPLASMRVDTQGVALLSQWVGELSSFETFAEWQVRHFNSTNDPDAQPSADAEGDGGNNELEFLTGTDPTSEVADAWSLSGVTVTNGRPQIHFDRVANVGFQLQSKTSLEDATPWIPVNVDGNKPFFAATGGAAVVTDDVADEGSTFYRMKVFEP